MPLDELLVAEVRAWLRKAASDLAAGDHDLTAAPPLSDDALFHAQQAAEKALKGFLFYHDVPFRKTHDLGEVGDPVREIDGSLAPLLDRAERLTKYAWTFRYPGAPYDPTRDEAAAALALAREVYDAVLTRLPSETHP